MTGQTVPFKGAICENWPPVKFIKKQRAASHQSNRKLLLTAAAISFSALSSEHWEGVGVNAASTGALGRDAPRLAG